MKSWQIKDLFANDLTFSRQNLAVLDSGVEGVVQRDVVTSALGTRHKGCQTLRNKTTPLPKLFCKRARVHLAAGLSWTALTGFPRLKYSKTIVYGIVSCVHMIVCPAHEKLSHAYEIL